MVLTPKSVATAPALTSDAIAVSTNPLTCTTPRPTMSSARAAASERSTTRPRTYGPRSVTSTSTLGGADAGNYALQSTTATTTGTISPRALPVTGIAATNRVYDGTRDVQVSVAGATVERRFYRVAVSP